MTFDEALDQVRELLRTRQRVTYQALKVRFGLDEAFVDGLKAELIKAERVAADEDGEVLVWIGDRSLESRVQSPNKAKGKSDNSKDKQQPKDSELRTLNSEPSAAERRQLTVMFIDLVGSTTLSQQLDPEDYHGRVVAYQAVCRQVIARYDGHIAQYLGDGVLAYFGYPSAHEEDAARAVRSGLEIVAAVGQLKYTPLLQVRVGIHTGPVVVGEIGAGERTERLALGETPNIAARVQGQAEPNEVMISATTFRLIQGLFETEGRGAQELKGISTPMTLYRVVRESAVQSRFEAAVQTGLTPLVGRAEELALLQRRWDQAKASAGQVVLLSGEPGIGKSRLVQEFKERFVHEGATRIEFRCSPYHQNSAFYPIIEHLQRLLQFVREDGPAAKLEKLQHTLRRYRFSQSDTAPLLATLLSLPHPEGSPPITVSPQKQKEKTQAALVAWLVEEAQKAAVLCVWEDMHWADPSTLEVLTLLLDQVPTTRLVTLLTFRPEFVPPWGNRSHLSQLTLSRLGRTQVEAMVAQVTGSTALPQEVVHQIVSKTDGVPLFVEELTKTVLESGSLGVWESRGTLAQSAMQFGIPTTLQDALMARLDRLGSTKEIAQLGATIGREFSYELLHAVSPVGDETLQQGLKQLMEVELVYQRGLGPQATYLFKHALIQDTAYHSLLKSTRQQYHQQIANVLEERFLETKETQPELLAHHYTAAGLGEQAVPYWQHAGERANQRSAYVEAISHLTKGLELLTTLPDTPERAQQELTLQIALGAPLIGAKGWGAPEVEKTYLRALQLCQQKGEAPELFSVLWGLRAFYLVRAENLKARDFAEQCFRLAQSLQDTALLIQAHLALGVSVYWLGDFVLARPHLEQGIAFYDPQQHRSLAFVYGHDPAIECLSYLAWTLLLLGYPAQSLQRSQQALTLAEELSHPFSLGFAVTCSSFLHHFRREEEFVRQRAEALITLCTEHEFPFFLAAGMIQRGWVKTGLGQAEEGIEEICRGIAAQRATGGKNVGPYFRALWAEACGKAGRIEEALARVDEALELGRATEDHLYEAELYRLKGQLTLQSQARLRQVNAGRVGTAHHKERGARAETVGDAHPTEEHEAEVCFLKAVEISRRQQAKWWELRATVSLARLWQQQGKKDEARQLLAEIYGWFTEGLDTKDLQEAKALLAKLH